jgi:hypothetical protein
MSRQDQRKDAITQYYHALKNVPNWEALKQARSIAAQNA